MATIEASSFLKANWLNLVAAIVAGIVADWFYGALAVLLMEPRTAYYYSPVMGNIENKVGAGVFLISITVIVWRWHYRAR